LSSFFDALLDDINFGYTNEEIGVSSISTDEVVLESPVISDENGDPVTNFALSYGPYSLAEIDSSQLSKLSEFEEKNVTWDGQGNVVQFRLGTADGIDPTKIYYVTVVPKNSDGVMGEISPNEICFRLSDEIWGEGMDCADGSSTAGGQNAAAAVQITAAPQQHNAAVDLSLANITHSIQGNTINLSRVDLASVENLEIFLMNEDGQTFTRLTTLPMTRERYSFTTNQRGSIKVRFIPLNAQGVAVGTEYIYTINNFVPSAAPTQPVPTQEVTSVPQVGPATDFALVGMGVLLLVIIATLRARARQEK